VNKPIVFDPQYFQGKSIGVDIVQMPWRTAFETILRQSGIWYQEGAESFQLVTSQGVIPGAQQQQQQPGSNTQQPAGQQPMAPQTLNASGLMPIDSTEILAKMREVTISAIFLEINTDKLHEEGINYQITRSSSSQLNYSVQFAGADAVSNKIFGATVGTAPGQLTVDISTAINFFQSNNLGQVISRPQITVRSGSSGRVQVGEDFSVKQRTISGDITETFFSTGSIMDVSPKVYNYQGVNFIDILLSVERSSLLDVTTSQIAKSKATTHLILLDGEEGYVGGLFSNDQESVREGVPFLKDLPWWVFGLRYIFGYNREQVTKKELIVLLKAELVPTLEDRMHQKARNVLEEKLKEGREDIQKRTQTDKN
jgi:general secretion pathway protein D